MAADTGSLHKIMIHFYHWIKRHGVMAGVAFWYHVDMVLRPPNRVDVVMAGLTGARDFIVIKSHRLPTQFGVTI